MAADDGTPDGEFDVAVIGAGVIGCAIARRFTLDGARVVVLEKAPDILDGASKGNSGILHTGFDAPPGSLEARCIRDGYAEYLELSDRLNLPVDRCGALVIAWTAEEEAALPALMDQARENGVHDVEPLDAAATRRLEPQLAEGVRASFRVPREFLVDPWSTPHAYLLQALLNGATLLRDCAVTGGAFDGARWTLETTLGAVRAGFVVNAAGNYGDIVDRRLLGRTDFTVRPRKGQFVVYDKPAAALARHILLPVPSKTTKGIVVCRTAFGNLLVGPTAEDQDDRAEARLVPQTLQALARRGAEILPALAGHEVTAVYAGLRPATEHKDYQIRLHEGERYVTVGGIRSTGLSSALGTARHVRALADRAGLAAAALNDPVWPSLNVIAETAGRDFESPGNGGIVCHCERVTRREIEAVLSDRLAPRSLAGLKRRTRVTMGRCQGFYCSAELAAITRGRLAEPIAQPISGAGDAA
jgi:glycerol-3-phosphate dehydrogenase